MKKKFNLRLLSGIILLHCISLQASDFDVIIRGYGRHGMMDLVKIGLKILSEEERTVMMESFSLFDEYSYPDSIPSTVEYNGTPYTITTLGDKILNNSYISSLKIPASVTQMIGKPFQNFRGTINIDERNPAFCSRNGVVMTKDEKKVIYITRSFSGTITIPEGVEMIEDSAAYGMRSIGESLMRPINPHCFSLPSSLRSIGKDAFALNFVDSFSVHNSNPYFTVVDGVLFNVNADTLIIYPGKKDEKYSTPSTTRHISDGAFAGSDASSVYLNDGLLSIGKEAFHGCRLSTIVLPGTLSSIGPNFISGYLNIQTPRKVIMLPRPKGEIPKIEKGGITPWNVILYVPVSEISLYQTDPEWNSFPQIEPYNIEDLGDLTDITETMTSTSISIQNVGPGKLSIISPQPCVLPLYSSDGTIKRTLQLSQGINSIEGLSSGIYILGGHKIVVE